jgi:hypothetical protein
MPEKRIRQWIYAKGSKLKASLTDGQHVKSSASCWAANLSQNRPVATILTSQFAARGAINNLAAIRSFYDFRLVESASETLHL